MNSLDDEYFVDSPTLTAFVERARTIVATAPDRTLAVKELRGPYEELLNDEDWLPREFQEPDPSGGMGEGIGNYLLFRSASRDLTLFTLVLPPGASTPVHDHLTWGLVGLYSGQQDEWVYRRLDSGADDGPAELEEVERRTLHRGDFYELLPPGGDIHRVRATGSFPSVSLHLLGNDIGCTWRHRFEPERHEVHLFRSAYSNQPCLDDPLTGRPL